MVTARGFTPRLDTTSKRWAALHGHQRRRLHGHGDLLAFRLTGSYMALIERLNDPTASRPHHRDAGIVGVATGADEVYVTKNRDVAEPDRMLPAVSQRRVRCDGEVGCRLQGFLPWVPRGLKGAPHDQ